MESADLVEDPLELLLECAQFTFVLVYATPRQVPAGNVVHQCLTEVVLLGAKYRSELPDLLQKKPHVLGNLGLTINEDCLACSVAASPVGDL